MINNKTNNMKNLHTFEEFLNESNEMNLIEESIVDKIKSLFQRTPAETKLLKSLDIFTDELLSPGEGKFDKVIAKAKEFGMDIDRDQAFKLLQKRLAMEIEELKN